VSFTHTLYVKKSSHPKCVWFDFTICCCFVARKLGRTFTLSIGFTRKLQQQQRSKLHSYSDIQLQD
jgi:hypothetical protein